jgi:hypothetical protein
VTIKITVFYPEIRGRIIENVDADRPVLTASNPGRTPEGKLQISEQGSQFCPVQRPPREALFRRRDTPL